jgi:solute carrier family 45 protein 1/2/4
MTGFSGLPMADEAASEDSAQWVGVAKVLGPSWARFPAVTVGLAGVQVMWSIEMAYGEQSHRKDIQPGRCITQQVM